MRARGVIEGASFGPEAVKAIGQAFDLAWHEIAGNFGHALDDLDALDEVELARLKLADAVLSVASEDSRDVDVLKLAALAVMAVRYNIAWPDRALSKELAGV